MKLEEDICSIFPTYYLVSSGPAFSALANFINNNQAQLLALYKTINRKQK